MKKRSTTTAKSSPQKPSTKSAPSSPPARSVAITAAPSTRLEVITIPSASTSEPPRISDLRPVRFDYSQSDASAVFLVGSFNGWNPQATPFTRNDLGEWSVEVALPPGEHRYRLMVDGQWRDDPLAQQMVVNPFGGFDALLVLA